jgi:membrane-bound acyltransferase YfiQ involved in biofilm formation
MEPATRTISPAKRRPELDALRALGCLLLLALSTVVIAVRAAVPVAERAPWYGAAQLLLVGGPVLAFLSGLLIHQKWSDEEGRSYLRRRFVFVGVPFLAWCGVYLAVEWSRPGAGTARLGDGTTAALGIGLDHLHLVAAVLQWYLLYPLVRWFRERTRWGLLVALSLGVSLAWLVYAPNWFRGVSFDGILSPGYRPWEGVVLAWLPYFVLGSWAAEHFERLPDLIPPPQNLYWPSAVMLALSGAILFTRHAAALGGAPGYAGAARPEVMGAAVLALPFLLVIAWRLARTGFASFLREIARYSFALFLIHPLMLWLVAQYVRPVGGPVGTLAVYGLLALVLSSLGIGILSRAPFGVVLAGLGGRLRVRALRPQRRAPAARRTRATSG